MIEKYDLVSYLNNLFLSRILIYYIKFIKLFIKMLFIFYPLYILISFVYSYSNNCNYNTMIEVRKDKVVLNQNNNLNIKIKNAFGIKIVIIQFPQKIEVRGIKVLNAFNKKIFIWLNAFNKKLILCLINFNLQKFKIFLNLNKGNNFINLKFCKSNLVSLITYHYFKFMIDIFIFIVYLLLLIPILLFLILIEYILRGVFINFKLFFNNMNFCEFLNSDDKNLLILIFKKLNKKIKNK